MMLLRHGRIALAAAAGFAAAACADSPLEPRVAEPARGPAFEMAAAEFSGLVRIGVVPAASSVSLGGTGEFMVRDKVTREVLLSASASQVSVTLESASVLKKYWRYQVFCTGLTTTRDTWAAKVVAAGYVPYYEQASPGGCWRLRVGNLPDAGYLNEDARTAWVEDVVAKGLTFGSKGGFYSFTQTEGELRFRVTRGASTVTASNPVLVEASSGFITINGSRYRGTGEVGLNSAGTLAGINEVPIEEYIYGVVPRELPPVPYGAMEAQKAQAVTARTYTIANLGKRRADGYDLLSTNLDQVYGGAAAEHPVSTAAVNSTAGEVAIYNGGLISTLYHSTSGGFTANSEDVYANPFAYLRGVPDAERGRALEHVPSLAVFKRHANPTNLRASAEGDFESDWSRYHRWTVDWTAAEMAQILSATYGAPVTTVNAISVTDRADQGRVRRIEFDTDAGVLVGLKDNIRSRLQYYDVNGSRAPLRSTLFYIEEVRDPRTKALTGWKAYGGGWGHGVGMSQTGAVGMAERGRTYQEILRHYYQGSSLHALY